MEGMRILGGLEMVQYNNDQGGVCGEIQNICFIAKMHSIFFTFL